MRIGVFAPIHISCDERGEVTEFPSPVLQPKPFAITARLQVANETRNDVSGTVCWSLRDPKGTILLSGEEQVVAKALDGVWLEKMDFTGYDPTVVHSF